MLKQISGASCIRIKRSRHIMDEAVNVIFHSHFCFQCQAKLLKSLSTKSRRFCNTILTHLCILKSFFCHCVYQIIHQVININYDFERITIFLVGIRFVFTLIIFVLLLKLNFKILLQNANVKYKKNVQA